LINLSKREKAYLYTTVFELKELIPSIFKEFNKSGPHLWLLYGDMGVGKTTFIQCACQYLGVEDIVQSPTFSIINIYHLPPGKKAQPVYHIDLYRVRDLDEALEAGVEEYLYSNGFCFVEWPQVIEPILPDHYLKLTIELQGDSSRKILLLDIKRSPA
jgi:tRNA threonylcarbamoyladenosine biosynthesis protein TsaE